MSSTDPVSVPAAPKSAEDHIAVLSALNDALAAARGEARHLEGAAQAALDTAIAEAEDFGLQIERWGEAAIGRIFRLAADLRKAG